MIKVPNPNCPRNDCRYVVDTEMSTSSYYQPIYNKQGENINPDGNVTSGEMTCSSCKMRWRYKIQYNKTVYQSIEQQNVKVETQAEPAVQAQINLTSQEEGSTIVTTKPVFIRI